MAFSQNLTTTGKSTSFTFMKCLENTVKPEGYTPRIPAKVKDGHLTWSVAAKLYVYSVELPVVKCIAHLAKRKQILSF